jgi:hypothetical protein
MFRKIHPTVELLIAICLHFLGDYVLQRLLPLDKRSSLLHMLIHAALADGLSFTWLGLCMAGWKGALFGLVLGTVSHASIDLIGSFKKNLVLKVIDQGAHFFTMLSFSVIVPSPYGTSDVAQQHHT